MSVPRDTPPRLAAERCVHVHSLAATCTRCVDVCPRDAWVLDGSALAIDPGVCDGCGLCAAVCPEGALTPAGGPALAATDGGRVAFVRCSAVAPHDSRGRVPCLHALGLRDLAALAARGVDRLLLAEAPCETCPRATAAVRSDATLRRLRALLGSRGRRPFRVEWMDATAWCRELARARPPDAVRRAFLRRLATPVAPVEQPAAEAWPGLPPGGPDALYPDVPLIDATRCEGCDACTRGCPHRAIERVRGPDGASAYVVRPERCSGCGLCVDLCEADAVVLEADAPAPPSVPLVETRCSGCRRPFHEPETRPRQRLCRVCRRVDRSSSLFRVLA